MSKQAQTIVVNAAHVRRHLDLPADATAEQITLALAKATPTEKAPARAKGSGKPKGKRRKAARGAASRDAAQEHYHSQHFPELTRGG